MNLEDVKHQTENLFDGAKMSEISFDNTFSPQEEKKLEILKESGLEKHYDRYLFKIRCEKAKKLGFQQVSEYKIYEMLMGESANKHSYGYSHCYEYFYNHQTHNVVSKNIIDSKYFDYTKYYCSGLFFDSKVCILGGLQYLKEDIPYGVLVKINEVKKLKLFNAFHVMAPEEAWLSSSNSIDSIVVATIFEYSITKDNSHTGKGSHFFLAQW